MSLKDGSIKKVYLKEYQPCAYTIDQVYLTFHLHESATRVQSRLDIRRTEHASNGEDLVLQGKNLILQNVSIDDRVLTDKEYEVSGDSLRILSPPKSFVLEIENEINPQANTDLEGLYKSADILCTQNEPQGFRRITYYLDRPDIMACFTTKIIGDKEKYPVMLSNGNLQESGDLENGMHFRVWHDPFPKPSYLYALVAGDLGLIDSTYTTASGREVVLHIYCDKGNEDRCHHAIESLKKAMRWDEETFGLEYDLDIYMIVAVDSFNMGAMENKGLNIFNSSYVLANPKTATDSDFLGIESVIAHEYFHNWTGNRVTCRDWFQLTLKEGLTVYRDQEFSCDMNSRPAQRIGDVAVLRSCQFAEDAGPMAHPIRPESYIEINNFYTATVYNKGAEVIRMLQVLFGKDGFRKGIDKYFELYDGQAVTTEDFLHAMSVANGGYDLSQFQRWYFQAGTPEVKVSKHYNEKENTLTLTLEQSCEPTPGQETKLPFVIPLRVGLIDKDGGDMSLKKEENLLVLSKEKEEFTFKDIKEAPLVSINRGFSAPVKILSTLSNDDLIFLLSNDSDEFNRYEASQTLLHRLIDDLLERRSKGKEVLLPKNYISAWGKILDSSLGPDIVRLCLTIPSESVLGQDKTPVDFTAIHRVRRFVMQTLAENHRSDLLACYHELSKAKGYSLEPTAIGQRSLKNYILHILSLLEDKEVIQICLDQLERAENMTDEIAALSALTDIECDQRDLGISVFYKKWKDETLVMQKWLAVQASSRLPDTLDRVLALEEDKVYDRKVPNLFRSLVGVFARNLVHFHHESGRGYAFVADQIIAMDSINPHMSAKLAEAFGDYPRLPSGLQNKMSSNLNKIVERKVSKHLFEIVSKILASKN